MKPLDKAADITTNDVSDDLMDLKRRNVSQSALSKALEHNNPEVVKFAASHPALKVTVGLLLHPKSSVRRLIVQRHDIEPEQIAKVMFDPELADVLLDHPLIHNDHKEEILNNYDANGGKIEVIGNCGYESGDSRRHWKSLHIDPVYRARMFQKCDVQEPSHKMSWILAARNNRTFSKAEEELDKGAMQRIAPFDPAKDRLPLEQEEALADWQRSNGQRNDVKSQITGHARTRALHKLSASTKTRNSPNGREFLLHRGMGVQEQKDTLKSGKVNHDRSTSSWTPDFNTANEFAQRYSHGPTAKPVSAWVNEKHIQMIPKQFGAVGPRTKLRDGNEYGYEHEVIVNPNHNSTIADAKEQQAITNPLSTPEGRMAHAVKGAKTATQSPETAKALLGMRFGKSEDEDTSFDFGANTDTGLESPDLHAKAMRSVVRMDPDKKQMAHNWIQYTKGLGQRPVITPELERHMAKFGIVDPAGYEYGEDGRSLNRPLAGRRGNGTEPDEFKRIRLMNLEHKSGIQQNYKSEEDLQKGKQGDWQKEGYTLKHNGQMELEDNGGPMSTITAHAPDGSEAGWLGIGAEPGWEGMEGNIKIHEPHRRKGLATAMYAMAEKIHGRKIQPADAHTSYAEGLWNQPNRSFGPKEIPQTKLTDKNPPTDPDALAIYNKTPHKYNKSEDLGKSFVPPSIAPVAMAKPKTQEPAATPLHSNVMSFMTGLKSLPKEGPARGKFVTANMNHAPFLNALNAHPQGKEMHKQLTGYLNGHANAGIGNGAKVTMKSEDLNKAKSGPTFPKLGLPDNRKETDIVTTPRQLEIKRRSIANAAGIANPQLKENSVHSLYDQIKDDNGAGMAPVTGPSSAGYSISDDMRHPDLHLSPAKATQEHENLHMMLKRVSDKYGPQARSHLVRNLLNHSASRTPGAMQHIEDFFQARNGKNLNSNPMGQEERLATTLNYVNSAKERDAYANYKGHTPRQQLNQHKRMRDFYGHVMHAASNADESWLTNKPNQIVAKSEDIFKNAETHQIFDQLGISPKVVKMIQAAEFLTGNQEVSPETVYRMVFDNANNDPLECVLMAYGLEVNDYNKKLIDTFMDLEKIAKAQNEDLVFQPVFTNDNKLVNELNHAVSNHAVNPINLEVGKYNSGAFLADTGDRKWLLKPNATKLSPAAGVREEPAPQSRREAAFYQLARQLEVGNRVPETHVVVLNGQEYAAIQFLQGWINLGRAKKFNEGVDQFVLEKYVKSGELFKWAILDYIAGNPDRHSSNILMADLEDDHGQSSYTVALIDHGAAFAGDSFNPARDPQSFMPYYLRAWFPYNWEETSEEDRIRFAPMMNDCLDMIREWAIQIDAMDIGPMLTKYGIDPNPTLNRLAKVKEFFLNLPKDSKNPVMELYLGSDITQ